MFQRILVPIDGSATANTALDAAIRLASQSGGRVRVIHLVEEMAYFTGMDQFGGYSGALLSAIREAGQKIIDEGIARARAAGVEADGVLVDQFGERLGDKVADAAGQWNADLVVVGTHGRKGLQRVVLGSGAEQVIRQSTLPVLVFRDPPAAA